LNNEDNLAEGTENSKSGLFARIRSGLGKTRRQLGEGLGGLVLGKKQIDQDILEEIETLLLTSDVGIEATEAIIDDLTEGVRRKVLSDPEKLMARLKAQLVDLLSGVEQPLQVDEAKKPFVILVLGVNGAGKTTTLGKLASRYKQQGYGVMLAAGDTYRAAATDQLQAWGERNQVPVVAQHQGADSASVIFDALESARARGQDILLADTAGRLQNKSHLMEELKKIGRVMGKSDASAPHEVLLVIDAGTGQNALQQARLFQECLPVTGIVLTKLDGTARGGIIFAIARNLGIPIRFIGLGEQPEDLQPFSAKAFVDALFEKDARQRANEDASSSW